jgi:hypothetical protein
VIFSLFSGSFDIAYLEYQDCRTHLRQAYLRGTNQTDKAVTLITEAGNAVTLITEADKAVRLITESDKAVTLITEAGKAVTLIIEGTPVSGLGTNQH